MAELEEKHWWFAARRQILLDVIDQHVPGLGRNALILDAGCGTGGNLSFFAERLQGTVVGMEMDDFARATAGEKSGCRVEYGMLPDVIPFENQAFELILLLDVLEHLEEEKETLLALKSKLKPGGQLLVTVPSYRFLWSPHDESHHHKRRYTRSELTTRLREAGFGITYSSYFNTWLFPAIAGVRLVKSRFKRFEHSEDTALPSSGINRLLYNLMSSEKYLMRIGGLPFGVSTLAIGKVVES